MWLNHLGVILRDSHEVVQMRYRSANKILRIVKSVVRCDLDLPKDSYYLIKKDAFAIRKRLERNEEGKTSMLILLESRIHRLARYYKPKGIPPANWKYGESSIASVHVA